MGDYIARWRAIAVHPPLTVQTGAGEMAVLRRAWYSKRGESATAGIIERAVVGRSNSNGVTPTARWEKKNPFSPNPTAPGQSWGTAPTVKGNPIVITDAGDKPSHHNSWTPPRPYAGIYILNADELYIDANTATNTSVDYMMVWSENDPNIDDRHVRGRRPRDPGTWFYANYSTGMNKGTTPATMPIIQNRLHWAQYATRRFNSRASMNTLLLVPAGGGGTTFNQALTATATTIAVIGRTTSKGMTATAPTSATIQRLMSKSLTASGPTTAQMQRTTSKSLSATATTVATIKRTVGKVLSATSVGSATIQRLTSKNLTATATSTATIAKNVLKSLIANASSSATIQFLKSFTMTLTATATTTASISRTVLKNMTATSSTTGTISKLVAHTMSATSTTTASIAATTGAVVAAIKGRFIKLNKYGIW